MFHSSENPGFAVSPAATEHGEVQEALFPFIGNGSMNFLNMAFRSLHRIAFLMVEENTFLGYVCSEGTKQLG